MPTSEIRKTRPILDRPVVRISNRKFDQWTDLSIKMDSERHDATFDLAVGPIPHGSGDWNAVFLSFGVEGFSLGLEVDRPQIHPGALVEIFFGPKPVFRGVLEGQSITSSGTSESLRLSGRCVLGLLKDSSVAANLDALRSDQSSEISGESDARDRLLGLAEEIVGEFTFADGTPAFTGVVLHDLYDPLDQLDRTPFKLNGPQPRSENCYSYLVRVAKSFGYPDVWVTGQGELVIGDMTVLREEARALGVNLAFFCFRDPALSAYNNILETQITKTISPAFSEVVCYGRGRRERFRTRYPFSAAVTDPTVAVTKVRRFVGDNIRDEEAALFAAQKELDAGRLRKLSITGTAPGYGQWVDGQDHFFEVNQPVHLVHELAHINWGGAESYLFYLSSVTYACSVSGGPRTSVTIRRELPRLEGTIPGAAAGLETGL